MTTKTTVAIAVPLEAELVERIRAVDPSVTVLYEPELLPPERFPGRPLRRSRTSAGRRSRRSATGTCSNKAQVLYGFPNESPAGLARIAGSNPRLQWIHAMAAGAGGAVKASGLDAGTLQKFKVTTSAGVHALPLAEFAALGILNGFKRSAELAQDQAAKVWPELRTPTRLVNGSRLVVTGPRRDRPGDGTDRPRPGHEGQRHQAERGAHRRHRGGRGQRRPRRPAGLGRRRRQHPARHAVHGEALQPRGLRGHEARNGLRERGPRHRGGRGRAAGGARQRPGLATPAWTCSPWSRSRRTARCGTTPR